ncbi:SIS domain-containing protein [Candidatus Hodarchaeum mangrovi]
MAIEHDITNIVSKTHMYKEIFQQPNIINQTLQNASKLFPDFLNLFEKNDYNLSIFGSGTSYHAGIAGSIAFTNIIGKYVPIDHASEWIYRYPRKGHNLGVAIAISQSGESGDVIRAAQNAKSQGLKLVSVTNVLGSTLDELGDLTFITPAGEEKAIAATKSYTSALALLLEWAIKLGHEHHIQQESLSEELRNVSYKMEKILINSEKSVKELTDYISNYNIVYFLGTGSNFSTALEGAMKLKETGNVYAEGFGFREFMHGHLQLVSEETPIIIVLSGEEDLSVIKSGIERLGNLKGSLFTITQSKEQNIETTITQNQMSLGEYVDPLISPLTLVLPLQLLACYNSKKRNLNPDKPTKLSKVTL